MLFLEYYYFDHKNVIKSFLLLLLFFKYHKIVRVMMRSNSRLWLGSAIGAIKEIWGLALKTPFGTKNLFFRLIGVI